MRPHLAEPLSRCRAEKDSTLVVPIRVGLLRFFDQAAQPETAKAVAPTSRMAVDVGDHDPLTEKDRHMQQQLDGLAR
jgi:hypothetical protein